MIKKIAKSIKALPINAVICLIVAVLYFFNNLYLKAHTEGVIHLLSVCHFNDFLGGILFPAYTNILLYTRGKLLHKFWHIFFFCLFAGLFWEFIAPLIKKNSVSDWFDVVSYVVGGIVYWALINCGRACKAKTWGTGHDRTH